MVGQPDISLSADYHDFGEVFVGEEVNWNMVISNDGDVDLTLNSINSDNSAFTIPSPNFPQNIPSGDSLDVTVRFSPSSEESYTGNLTIASNDSDKPEVLISVEGVGIINNPPDKPVNESPADEETEVSLPPELVVSAFSDPDAGDSLSASQFQITVISGDYTDPIFDSVIPILSPIVEHVNLDYGVTYLGE